MFIKEKKGILFEIDRKKWFDKNNFNSYSDWMKKTIKAKKSILKYGWYTKFFLMLAPGLVFL